MGVLFLFTAIGIPCYVSNTATGSVIRTCHSIQTEFSQSFHNGIKMFLYSFESSHTNPLRNNNNIETDEGLSFLDIGGNHIDLDKTIICKIVLESCQYLNSLVLRQFLY